VFVICWKTFPPWFVNCISTTGPCVGSMSARVPESFRSLPVISGIGLGASAAVCLNRYHDVFVGFNVFWPGQTTSPLPHDATIVPFGTPKILYTGVFDPLVGLPPVGDLGGFAPLPLLPPAPRIAATPYFFALRVVNSESFVGAGPTKTFLSLNRYHWLAPF